MAEKVIKGAPADSDSPIVKPEQTITMLDLERIVDKLLAMRGSGGGADHELMKAAVDGMKGLRDEVERTVRRSNASHPGISVFSYPEGDVKRPKPKLKYEVYFCGGKQREDQLKPREIDLFNQFTGSKEARDGAWTARLERDGNKKKLFIDVPAKTIDHLSSLPQELSYILTELLYGADVVDPLKQMDRIHELEARLAQLEKNAPKLVDPGVPA